MKKKNHSLINFLLLVCILPEFYLMECYAQPPKSTKTTTQYQVYENKKFGFILYFPISWKGYFMINESATDYIEVCFVGKRKTSKNINTDSKKIHGLTMFFIGTEKYVKDNEFIDGKRKIGTSHKVNYYYFTSTDSPILALFDVSNSDTEDEEEKEKARNDLGKYKQMEKDIDNILKTFKVK